MPGIENFDPERTDSSRGFWLSPSFLPISASRCTSLAAISVSTSSGTRFPPDRYMLQTCVETVNPGGTGMPARAISARLAPLPPRVSRMDLSPSVLEPPNEYTCCAMVLSSLCPETPAGSLVGISAPVLGERWPRFAEVGSGANSRGRCRASASSGAEKLILAQTCPDSRTGSNHRHTPARGWAPTRSHYEVRRVAHMDASRTLLFRFVDSHL